MGPAADGRRRWAGGPGEALQRARGAGEPFPLVLADSHMPEPDGLALADWIAGDGGPAGSVILLSAATDPTADAARARGLGIAATLLKPVKLADLVQALKGSISFFSTGGAFAAASELEQFGCDGTWDRAEAACAALEPELSGLSEVLSGLAFEVATCSPPRRRTRRGFDAHGSTGPATYWPATS